jgi:hypothetical protein
LTTVLTEAHFVDAIEAAAFEDFFAAAPKPLARDLGLRVTKIAGATLLHAPGIPQAMFNRAIGLGVHCPLAEAELDAAIAEFRAAGFASYWIHYNPVAAPITLPNWLQARGFTLPSRRSWAKMCRGAEPVVEIDVDFEVREAKPGEARALAQVVCNAFAMPSAFEPWFVGLAARPRWRAYAALDGTRVVGAGYLYLEGTDAWLGIGGVLPEMRGRNAHRALMALRIRDAVLAGCARIATETGEPIGSEPNPSLANMRYCGFRQVCSRLNYAATA